MRGGTQELQLVRVIAREPLHLHPGPSQATARRGRVVQSGSWPGWLACAHLWRPRVQVGQPTRAVQGQLQGGWAQQCSVISCDGEGAGQQNRQGWSGKCSWQSLGACPAATEWKGAYTSIHARGCSAKQSEVHRPAAHTCSARHVVIFLEALKTSASEPPGMYSVTIM